MSEEVSRSQIKDTVEKRVLDALRILRPDHPAIRSAHEGFQEMTQHSRDSIFGHAAVAVESLIIRERRARRESADEEQDSDLPVDYEAAEALSDIMRITAWTKDRVINEALQFMLKALQSEAVSR